MTRPIEPPRSQSRHPFSPDGPGSAYCRCGLHADEEDHRLEKPEMVPLKCHICGKDKGQPPDRCPGHYTEAMRCQLDGMEPAPAPSRQPAIDPEAVELQNRIEAILSQCGSFASCKSCLQPIYWMSAIGGKKVPYDRNGLAHSGTCQRNRAFGS